MLNAENTIRKVGKENTSICQAAALCGFTCHAKVRWLSSLIVIEKETRSNDWSGDGKGQNSNV